MRLIDADSFMLELTKLELKNRVYTVTDIKSLLTKAPTINIDMRGKLEHDSTTSDYILNEYQIKLISCKDKR